MTRRVIKPQPNKPEGTAHDWEWKPAGMLCYDDYFRSHAVNYCPYGQVGDGLWVRETWLEDEKADSIEAVHGHIYYKADYIKTFEKTIWRPSIFMPRWASRIDLEITDIRVERLQEISSSDCLAEGLSVNSSGIGQQAIELDYKFKQLWNSLNAKRCYSWESNCWVWVIEFKRQISTELIPERLEGVGYVPKCLDFNSSCLIHSYRAFFAQGGGSNVQDLIFNNSTYSKLNKGGRSRETPVHTGGYR